MRNRLILPFIFFCLAAVFLTVVFMSLINNTFESNKELRESDTVTINDIEKNAQRFLETKDNTMLSNSLVQNRYDIVLYDPYGTVIYDSSDKNNLGKRADIRKILSEVEPGKKISLVTSTNDYGDKLAVAVISTNREKPGLDYLQQSIKGLGWFLSFGFILLTLLIFLFIYFYMLRPFKRLENFAGEVAKGNLDMPIGYKRRNFFGAFTWAFDMMRNELKISKEREMEAERTKKELVAALSHDIRTPIAAISAYAECLKGLPDKNSARSEKYIDVILKKTDEIAKLSQDMFLHAISDLEKLEMAPAEHMSRELINNIIEPLMLQYENRMVITSAIPDVCIYTDKMRLAQVFENVISNTSKYSPESDIYITSYISDEMLVCCLKDNGKGVLPEDIPFLFDKFFRGKNAKESGKPGSGLGLYISRYILEKTGGHIKAYNYSEGGRSGFAVEILLKIVKSSRD